MSRLDDFLGPTKEETEIISGAFPCDECNHGANVATYNDAKKILIFTCVKGHTTKIEPFTL